MYKIALCDDDVEMLRIIGQHLKDNISHEGVDSQIDLYKDSQKLMTLVEAGELSYDAYFLDIDMPFVSGMAIAAKLYENDVQNNIIFITDREDLVFEAIHYRPFRFIRKSHLTEEIGEAVKALLDKKARENIICRFACGKGEELALSVKEIYYIESSGHYLKVYAKEEVYKVRGKISSYERELSDCGFVRIYNTLLVNIRYIYSVSLKGVVMDDEKVLPVSRHSLRNVKEKHMEYMRRYINGND